MTHKPDDADPVVVPRLRFPKFKNAPLRPLTLGDVTAECTDRRGKEITSAPIMGVSKTDGIVPMEERLIGKDTARYKCLEKNWFAYNPMRLNIGSIARWKGETDVLVSPDYVVFRCVTECDPSIDPDYLDHFRSSDQWENFVTRSGDGGVRIRIYFKDLAKLPITLPSPAEQRKIADCLTSLDEVIAAQGRKVEALKAHKKGLMQDLFPREGETLPRRRFPEFRDAWNATAFETLTESISSGKDKASRDGAFDLYGSTGIIARTDTASYSGPHILVARVGANAGFLTRATGAFGATDNTLVVVLKDEQNVDFVYYHLDNCGLNQLVFGSGQPLITGGQLKSLLLGLPGKGEQQRIAACLSSLDARLAAEADKLASLKQHKQGLMQQLFPAAATEP